MTDEEKKLQKQQERYKKQQDAIEKLIKEGKLPEIKALTRGQRKELDKAVLNYLKTLFKGQETAVERQEKCYDWILEHVYQDFNFDDLPNNICYYFADQVYNATYSDKFAEKN